MSQLNYRVLGFTLTLPQTAEVLECSQGEVRDLLLMGDLAAVLTRDGVFEPVTWLFHPDEVREYAEKRRTRAQGVDSRNRSRVLALLRDYLRARPADDDYDNAMLRNSALLTSTREGVAVNVVPEAMVAFNRENDLRHGPVTASMIEETLAHAGAVRVRGVTPLNAPRTQRWGWSWRLPDALRPDADDTMLASAVTVGVVEPGEKVTRVGGGPATLVDPLST